MQQTKWNVRFWLLAFCCAVLATSPATAQADEPLEASEIVALSSSEAKPKRVMYKQIGDVKLYLHVFSPEGHTSAARRPAMVFFFGGGWKGGSPRQFYPHCRYLAARGMVAAAAEYRVQSRHGTTPFECVRDGKSAVRYLRAHADELGIDPERIAAGGGSAGGHVAASTGTLSQLDEPGEDLNVSSRPVALVLFNPVVDTSKRGYGYDRIGDRWREISPVEHITNDTPPTILFHGTNDTTVPFENAERFAARMKALGNRCELIPFEGAGHGFFNFGRDGSEAYVRTVRAMEPFLASLDLLPK